MAHIEKEIIEKVIYLEQRGDRKGKGNQEPLLGV